MLELTIGSSTRDPAIAPPSRDRLLVLRRRVPGHEPAQAALLEAWLGGREDLAVVGDEDQSITRSPAHRRPT
jgi:hypothetical protein